MAKVFNRKNILRACALILGALVLAVGLEWLMLRTLPPIFTDAAVEIPTDPGLMDRSAVYLHSSGRLALKEEWYAPRLLVGFLIQLAVLTIVFPMGLGRRIAACVQKWIRSLKRVWREEKKQILKSAVCFALAWGLVYVICRACILDVYYRDNWITHTVSVLAGVCAGCLVAFPKTLGKKPEVFFLILTLIYGGTLSWFLPDGTRVALDDGYHYQHAANFSTLGHVRFTGAEWDSMQENFGMQDHLDLRDAFLESQDRKHAQGAVFVTTAFHMDPKEFWMASHGLGLFLGRVFHLRYWDYWSLGRFSGLLAFALVGYFAIRRLKSGKMILTMALMIPTTLFLACNYSYDPGVTGGIALSFSYWIAQWQERDQKLKNGDVAVMLGGMLLGCFPKAIYFPVMLILLFLPKSKFRSRAHRRNYTLLVLFTMLLLILYILLPLAFSGGAGDERAGGDVDTFRQIQYILSHPLDYALDLWHEIMNFLDLNHMGNVTNSLGYMGGGISVPLVLMVLAVVTLTDQSKEGLLPPISVRAASEVLLFGTFVLMLTAMYAWYSDVGSSTFGGVQGRYLLPLFYPAMSMLGSNRNKNQMNPALYNGLLFAAMLFANYSVMIQSCIEIYR